MRLALKLFISLGIPQDFNAVLTGLISKPTKNCTVHYVCKNLELKNSKNGHYLNADKYGSP